MLHACVSRMGPCVRRPTYRLIWFGSLQTIQRGPGLWPCTRAQYSYAAPSCASAGSTSGLGIALMAGLVTQPLCTPLALQTNEGSTGSSNPPPSPVREGVLYDAESCTGSISEQRWSLAVAARSIGVFICSGLFEIGGGWLVWQAVKEGKPWWYAGVGSIVLAAYGFIATLQPDIPAASFGRVYAVYGGFFIVLSYIWGFCIDGLKLDRGDKLGAALALAGVLVAWFWPR